MASKTETSKSPFWLEPLPQLLTRLESAPTGLTQAAARAALSRYGANRLQTQEALNPWRLLTSILANPLVLVLLVASGVSAAVGEHINATIILVIVLLSSVLEFSQSYRSSQAAQKLRQSVATTATVVREGRERELPLEEIVPGDVVVLNAGTLVPGDARLISSKDLFTAESALTGESLPAEKEAGELPAGAATLTQARNALFMGTSVVSGLARAVVVHTGLHTEFGKVAQHLLAKKPETEFERGIHGFGVLIMRTVIALVAFVFLTNIVFHRPPMESLLFSIALAVGLTPEFLPMIISVSLAAGAVRLAKQGVIVKRLASIENLGSISILCSDKTGTLTLGQIELERYVDLDNEECPEVLRYAAINSQLESGIRSPLDTAILAHQHPPVDYRKIDELPFDFKRRRLSVVADGPSGRLLITKGAPEGVDPLCNRYRSGDKELPLDEAARTRLRQTFEALSQDGFRVLSVAVRPVEVRDSYTVKDETELCLVGLAAFLDPPREDARQTLEDLQKAGISVKILTGDNEMVTRKVCLEVGLDANSILLGGEVDALADEALSPVAERTTIFARLSPEQKNRILGALRTRGHVVGYLGDGINDAPALQSADIGISVENAVDVAKESADIILLKPGLRAVFLGVMEGRRSFGNIMKYILMGTSSNFGNMFSMAGASLFLPFLPLLPSQLLLNNLLYDVSQLAIPGDNVDSAYLTSPRRWDTDFIRRFMWFMGPISSLFDFATFAILLEFFHADEALFHTGWFIESLATQILVIFVIRTSGPAWKSRPNPALIGGACLSLTVAFCLPLSPLASKLGFVAPPLEFYGFLAVALALYLSMVEGLKRFFYRRYHLS